MAYIQRGLENKLMALSKEYACILLTGPRQVGKTTVLRTLMTDSRKYVTLDDLEERGLAKRDPAMFLQMHPAPLMIDEVQYAPELFTYIKIEIDKGAAPGSYWLTGSQAFSVMELAQESLAGRTAVLHMTSLSQHEIFGSGDCPPFTLELTTLKVRETTHQPAGIKEIYERIWNGSMPGLISGKFTDRDVFYSSYLQTYIDRDVKEQVQLSDPLLFRDFVRATACRAGQMLNLHDIAGDVGVSDDTAKRWLQVLEKSDIIFLLRPYSNNLLKRTVKTPKLYFFDTGLVAYLTRYSSPEILANGAINGAILENFVAAELLKSYHNNGKECLLWYYRDRSSNEIDLVIESDGLLHPLEIKRSVNPGSELTGVFGLLDKASIPRGKGAILCMRSTLSAVDSENFIVPIWMI
ncbi:ATP-binding protein [Acutalibacter muris]|uniref:ATP-binding protein n=2 Tax=Acutalibacter muris TaxID=1796620 RepID=A0A1Z2XUS4_9FIRM|nr:ATP-binding protein [Acutalibacter muris]ANU54577.1 ATPase [Hungateiclostridiaceae bacterium KB18]ASB42193.1 ATPase [Acutalibacter muris]QQR31468.1 ATP-binding protein [Acutalibacter muris]